jgi:PPK2 family polyphosphate:nucleotide phosphotransferase
VAHPDPVEAPRIADFARYLVEPGEHVSLDDHDPADTGPHEGPEEIEQEFSALVDHIANMQERLYAEERRALLVVLQGIDAAGKDSTVKHVFRETNPQGCRVYAFKQPSQEEQAHDFLWRYHKRTPAMGMIHIFNRSHYEDVLVVRVKGLEPEEVWRSRYDSINDFERMLVREGTTILKFLLHISKEEQLEKFRERLERQDKYWKWSPNDIKERERWDEYQQAYEEAVSATSTPWAPWYVVPANHRWFRNYVAARVLAGTLHAMDPRFPEPPEEVRRFAERELAQSG